MRKNLILFFISIIFSVVFPLVSAQSAIYGFGGWEDGTYLSQFSDNTWTKVIKFDSISQMKVAQGKIFIWGKNNSIDGLYTYDGNSIERNPNVVVSSVMDSDGGNLYFYGVVNGVTGIYYGTGSSWTRIPNPPYLYNPNDLRVFKGVLYFGSAWVDDRYIYHNYPQKYDGSSWTLLGSTSGNPLGNFIKFNENIYLYASAGIFKYDKTTNSWQTVPSNFAINRIPPIREYNNKLYFMSWGSYNPDTQPPYFDGLGSYDGTNFVQEASLSKSEASDMIVFGGKLYITMNSYYDDYDGTWSSDGSGLQKITSLGGDMGSLVFYNPTDECKFLDDCTPCTGGYCYAHSCVEDNDADNFIPPGIFGRYQEPPTNDIKTMCLEDCKDEDTTTEELVLCSGDFICDAQHSVCAKCRYPEAYPPTSEPCDGVDNNCNDVTDEGCYQDCTSCKTSPDLFEDNGFYYDNICVEDKDKDGFIKDGNYADTNTQRCLDDCNDESSSQICSEVVCCQDMSTTPEAYFWGIKNGDSGCDDDATGNKYHQLRGSDSERACRTQQGLASKKDYMCNSPSPPDSPSPVYSECAICNNPKSPDIGCINRDCSTNVQGTYAQSNCGQDEQCVIYGSKVFDLKDIPGFGQIFEEWERCKFYPGAVSDNNDAECYLDEEPPGIMRDTKKINCLIAGSEGSEINSIYGELDINKLVSEKDEQGNNNPCRYIILHPTAGYYTRFPWQTACVKKDKCMDEVDNDGKENINNIFAKFNFSTGIEIPKRDFSADTCEETVRLEGKEILVKLADGDDPDCYDRGWDGAWPADNDKFLGTQRGYCKMLQDKLLNSPQNCNPSDLFCETLEQFIQTEQTRTGKIIPSACWSDPVSVDYCISHRECFPYVAPELFPDCDNYLDDDERQDFNHDGIPDYNHAFRINDRAKLIPPEKYEQLAIEKYVPPTDYKPISAYYVHPFAPLGPWNESRLCGRVNYLDLNCNKDYAEGYNQDYESGFTPWDDNSATGVEEGNWEAVMFPEQYRNRDALCMPTRDPDWQVIKYGAIFFYSSLAVVTGQLYVPALLITYPFLTTPAIILSAFYVGYAGGSCAVALGSYYNDENSEWCPWSPSDECVKSLAIVQGCGQVVIIAAAAGAQIGGKLILNSPTNGRLLKAQFMKTPAEYIATETHPVPELGGRSYTGDVYLVKSNWITEFLGVPKDGKISIIDIGEGKFIFTQILPNGQGLLVDLVPTKFTFLLQPTALVKSSDIMPVIARALGKAAPKTVATILGAAAGNNLKAILPVLYTDGLSSKLVKLGVPPEIADQFETCLAGVAGKLERTPSTCPVVPKQVSSFLAGTRILMEDGSYKNIEDIKEGDRVVAYDVENNTAGNATVTETFNYHTDEYRIIEYEVIENGK